MLHHGHKLDTDNRARAPPIFQTTSFEFKSAEHGGALFELSQLGPIYTRLMNPTTHVLEYKVAKLEGAPCKAHGDCDNATTLPNALAVASGQSAQMHALLTFMSSGDNFVASTDLYGGTWNLFANTMKDMGIECRFVDPGNPKAFANATDAPPPPPFDRGTVPYALLDARVPFALWPPERFGRVERKSPGARLVPREAE